MAIAVMVVDDDPMVRLGVAALVGTFEGVESIGAAESAEAAVGIARDRRPDVVLMDVAMPGVSGVQATELLLAEFPDVRVLALTTVASPESASAMLAAGAVGYLLKSSTPQVLEAAIRQAVHGEGVVSTSVAKALRAHPTSHEGGGSVQSVAMRRQAAGLTISDTEVLDALAEGMSNRQIAATLFLSEAGVKARLIRLGDRLGVQGRVGILVKAVSRGLVEVGVRGDDQVGAAVSPVTTAPTRSRQPELGGGPPRAS